MGDEPLPPSDGSTSITSDSSTASPTTTSPTTTTPADDTTGSAFLTNPDLGEGSECDYFAQDCAPGLKCAPWANDGGGAWNSTRCTPIAEDPAGVDEPCRVEINGVSGLDDCELGLYCWYVEPKTNEGRCIPLCIGSEVQPECSDPARACWVSADASIAICRPVCDPLAPSCDEGLACHPIDGSWQCAEDASGDMGAYGDPCEYINVCDPGLVCIAAEALPPGLPCEDAAGCCTDLCDLDDPLGDLQCTGVAAGSTCQPWYDDAPPLFEHVGACALPIR